MKWNILLLKLLGLKGVTYSKITNYLRVLLVSSNPSCSLITSSLIKLIAPPKPSVLRTSRRREHEPGGDRRSKAI